MLAYGRRVLDATAELAGELGRRISGPSGWVRVSMSLVIAKAVIAPHLEVCTDASPKLHGELRVDDRLADLAREGVGVGRVMDRFLMLLLELRHKAIIDRFGRYPHRDQILGRVSSAAEVEFLKPPGSSF